MPKTEPDTSRFEVVVPAERYKSTEALTPFEEKILDMSGGVYTVQEIALVRERESDETRVHDALLYTWGSADGHRQGPRVQAACQELANALGTIVHLTWYGVAGFEVVPK